jgi:hypothetical protein
MANGQGTGYNAHSKLPPHRRPTQISGQADVPTMSSENVTPGAVKVAKKAAKVARYVEKKFNPFD